MEARISVSSHQLFDDGSWSVTWLVTSNPVRLMTWIVTSPTVQFRPARMTSTTRSFSGNERIPAGQDTASVLVNVRWEDNTTATLTGTFDKPGPGQPPGPVHFGPVTPARLLDTRPGHTTVDGQHAGAGPRPTGSTLELPIAGRHGIPTDATAVVLNVTVTEPTAPGYITVHPTGEPLPTAANLNYTTGQTIPNAVIAELGTNGTISLYNTGATHLVVDISGWYIA
jgi:hypothetical protein